MTTRPNHRRGQAGGGSWWMPVVVVLLVLILGALALLSSGVDGNGPLGNFIETIDDAMGGGQSSIRVMDERGELRVVWKREGPARVEWNHEPLPAEDYEIRDGLLTFLAERRTDGARVHMWQGINERAFLVAYATTPEERLGLILGPDEEGGLAVRSVLPATPAHDAGLEVGDVLLAVDGSGSVSIAALRSALIRHITGGEVLLTARRGADALSFALPLTSLVSQDAWDASEREDPLSRYLELAKPDDERFLIRGFVGPPDT